MFLLLTTVGHNVSCLPNLRCLMNRGKFLSFSLLKLATNYDETRTFFFVFLSFYSVRSYFFSRCLALSRLEDGGLENSHNCSKSHLNLPHKVLCNLLSYFFSFLSWDYLCVNLVHKFLYESLVMRGRFQFFFYFSSFFCFILVCLWMM